MTSLLKIPFLIVTLLLGLCLAGCQTVAPNGLSAADTANLKFTSIEVAAPSANIRWTAAEDEYLKSRNLSQTDPALVNTSEARSHIENLAAARLKAALEKQLANRPAGMRPARIVVTIKRVIMPSLAARAIVGPAAASIDADLDIVDARTGAILTRYSGDHGSHYAPGGLGALIVEPVLRAAGFDDQYDQAAANYARKFDAWLARS